MSADNRITAVKLPYSRVRRGTWPLALLMVTTVSLPVAILSAQPQSESPTPQGSPPPSLNGCTNPQYWVNDSSGKVQWGDMTITYASTPETKATRVLARLPMKPTVVKAGVSGVYLVLGNFQVCSKANGATQADGDFKSDPLKITIAYSKELLWRLEGAPKDPRLYFWDNVHGVWHSIGLGEEIKPDANNQMLSVKAEKTDGASFTVTVFSWPADDVCLIFGG